eukprot:1176618-Pleurochrysis_carterae.AAC.1
MAMMAWSPVPSESGRILLSEGSRCVEVSTMFGPEGLGTVDTTLPLALGAVWCCSTSVLGSETRAAACPEDLGTSCALINASSNASRGSL